MLRLNFIFFLLFLLLSNRFYSDDIDLSKDKGNNAKLPKVDAGTTCSINAKLPGEEREGDKEKDERNDPSEGFYRTAYADFSARYNTNLSSAEKEYLKCEKVDNEGTLGDVKQTTVSRIREGFGWLPYKRCFYSSDKYHLYWSVYGLYRPYAVLFLSCLKDNSDFDIGIESGYRRFDFLKRNVLDMPIRDVKTPIIRISFAVDGFQPKGYISSFEYNFSVNRNVHLGLVWDIVPLPRYYNKFVFYDLKENSSEEDTNKTYYNYNFKYLFLTPFYSYAFYKSDDERYISYLNVSCKHFKVNETGGCSCDENVCDAGKYFYEGSRTSKFDAVTSYQSSYSIFFFSQYKSVEKWRCYFLFDFLKEKNEVEITKETEAILPPAIRNKMPPRPLEDCFDEKDEAMIKYFCINANTIKTLKLEDKLKTEDKHKQYSSSSRFSKTTFSLGFENIPFLFFNFDIFSKLSLCVVPSGIEECIDRTVINSLLSDKKIYEPVVGFVIRPNEKVKMRVEILFDEFKLKPYFKYIFEGREARFLKLLKVMVLLKKRTVFDILNGGSFGSDDKQIFLSLYFLSKKINITDRLSFSFITRMLVSVSGSYYKTIIEIKDNKPKEHFSVLGNGNFPLFTWNSGLKFKIIIFKNFFLRSLILFNKKVLLRFFTLSTPPIQNESCDNIPLLSCFVKLYYKRRMKEDNNSFLAYGLSVKYETFYYPDEFYILTQQWYNCTPNNDLKDKFILPVIDLFFNLRLGWLDISWEVTDLIQAFSGYASVLSPHYIRKPWSPFNFIISFITLN